MIKSFRSAELQAFFERSNEERIPTDWTRKISIILDLLDAATAPEDMAVVGFRFHAYAEGRQPRFGVMVSKAWRISFTWKEGDAHDVSLDPVS